MSVDATGEEGGGAGLSCEVMYEGIRLIVDEPMKAHETNANASSIFEVNSSTAAATARDALHNGRAQPQTAAHHATRWPL